MDGWIKLHRKLLDWEWANEPKTLSLFIHILLLCNHEDGRWRGILVKRGQHITSYEKLAQRTGLTKQEIRTRIKWLKSTHELTYQTTSTYAVVTVLNYDDYQSTNTPANTQLTPSQHSTNTQLTPNKNDKKKKKEKNNNKRALYDNAKYSSFREFSQVFIDRFNKFTNSRFKLTKKVETALSARLKNGWTLDEIGYAIFEASKDNFINGTDGKKYLTPEYILREDKLNRWYDAHQSKLNKAGDARG